MSVGKEKKQTKVPDPDLGRAVKDLSLRFVRVATRFVRK